MLSNKHDLLRCPICNRRIIDSAVGVKVRLFPSKSTEGDPPDFYLKCPGCKKEIAIKKIS